ncbi:MICOS complex subunit MIC19 isoform X1 [Hydra vulgaris]|uniref:MICOS complex subunit MIC19 isoform X1 n=1 Tax=Hydra vulgaris TaxID=6087 RepID=UPI0001923D46|nr:MICOS complex subunit MIC19 [Hydra vulgaris]
MGNGESTTRRIALQRSDDGTIQITENVLAHLKGKKSESTLNGSQQHSVEEFYNEDELKEMLEQAYRKGQESEYKKSVHDIDLLKQKLEEREKSLNEEHTHKLQEIENYWKEKLSMQDNQEVESYKKLAEEKEAKLVEKEAELDNVKNELHKKLVNLSDEFDRGVKEIEDKINPLQQKSVCNESLGLVLSCYKANNGKPLRCSQEVKDFMNCVQETRVKQMKKNI